MKDDLSQKIHGQMIISVLLVKILFLFPTNTLKDDISGITGKNDINPRKYGVSSDREIKDLLLQESSNNSLYFYGDFHGHFHRFLSSEKRTGNVCRTIYIGLKLDFFFKLQAWRHYAMKNI